MIAIVQGGLAHGQHGHLDYVARQIFVDSSDTDELDRHAFIWGVSDGSGGFGRKQPTAASGTTDVDATGVATLPDQFVLTRTDGERFLVQGDVNFTGLQTASVPVIAEDAGADGNTATGSTLDLSSPIANIATETTVESPGLTGGADVESDPSLIVRILQKIREGGNAGGPGFYEEIATGIDGVTRVKELPQQLGPGTVQVVIIDDNSPSKIPSGTIVSNVQAAIDLVAPVTAIVTVTATLTNEIDVSADITLDTDALLADVVTRIKASLTEFFADLEPGDTVFLTAIANAVQDVEGVIDHNLTGPAADIPGGATPTTLPIGGTFLITETP